MYSDVEQRARVENRPPWIEDGPLRTPPGRTAWSHLVTADICNGHLVLLASHESPSGSYELLGRYTAGGEGAVFYSEGGGFYGVSRHPGLDSALREWEAYGYASQLPDAGSRRAAALSASPARATHTTAPLPQSTVPAMPWPTTGHAPRPF